jgi:hypothetical protein
MHEDPPNDEVGDEGEEWEAGDNEKESAAAHRVAASCKCWADQQKALSVTATTSCLFFTIFTGCKLCRAINYPGITISQHLDLTTDW